MLMFIVYSFTKMLYTGYCVQVYKSEVMRYSGEYKLATTTYSYCDAT